MKKELYNARIKAGLCTLCGSPNDTAGRKCSHCTQHIRAARAERYRALRIMHRCTDCGRKLSAVYSGCRCTYCIERRHDYWLNAKRRKADD